MRRPPARALALLIGNVFSFSSYAREYAVNLFDGVYGRGEGHAPMVYAGDPRQDVPSALRKHLTETLRDRDATIVKGWLEGIAEGGTEDLGLD